MLVEVVPYALSDLILVFLHARPHFNLDVEKVHVLRILLVKENYERAQTALKDILNPITYMMEQNNPNIPKKFNVKSGIYRIDSSGNALFRNLTAEKGKFSRIEAYDFKVNKLNIDKLVLTSVASNVVDTDNLLKSRGIAEFEGAVNVMDADVFLNESKVNVSQGTEDQI